MDDDCNSRRNKPQQKIYTPGSGPLRRTSYGLETKMDNYGVDNDPRGRPYLYGSQNSVNELGGITSPRNYSMGSRHKKPEQQLYVPRSGDATSDGDRQSKVSMRGDNSSQYNNRRMSNKSEKQGMNIGTGSYPRGARREFHHRDGGNNDINYNRQYRQQSETRSMSPAHALEQNNGDRNRDSRSMETSAGRHMSGGGGKPPSGRRNSAGYSSDSGRHKYMGNLDNIPPRFRKKYSEQSAHHSFDSVDQINKDKHYLNSTSQPSFVQNQFYNNSNTGWSQTLPSRGRGRLRDNENFDREKFINSYLKNNYDSPSSRRSTPSSSYMNLYDPHSLDNRSISEHTNAMTNSVESQQDFDKSAAHENGMSNVIKKSPYNHKDSLKDETSNQQDCESISQISSSIMEMTLDWTEEVEKNIKLDDLCDSSTSFLQNFKSTSAQDSRSNESNQPKESKKGGKSKRRDKRSSSRGHRNAEKKSERVRKDSNVSTQESEHGRRDSNVSIHHEAVSSNLKQRERERRDSHRSNKSSTIGNSRDDLDRWRSLRSYSKEPSTDGRIVSQCNSRDPSANRASSPRDNDGFRVPSSVPKSGAWSSTNQKKNNGSWSNARTPSVERGRVSPAGGGNGGGGGGGGEGEGGGGRKGRKKTSRRKGRHADPPPCPHPPGATPAPTSTNWRDEIKESKKHDKQQENSHQRNRLNSTKSDKSISESTNSHPGILILPQNTVSHIHKDHGRGGSKETQKTLYDHHNPSKPIFVRTSPTKLDMRLERGTKDLPRGPGGGNTEAGARALRHRALLQEVDRADAVLQAAMIQGPVALAAHWTDIADTRKSLQNALQRLLMSDLKFCQEDNIEHQFWKILYYNFIELLRKSFTQISQDDKVKVVRLINLIIEEGNLLFENLVQMLEKAYKFNTDDYINDNHMLPPKGLGYVGLALISVQKLYVFLGDLARYKEQINETNNYAKSKFWYTKAQQINPKNGRPYNQLAILAIYARRKLDAVYYYMRSLMSSNPFHSARESLLSLFDENSKKYETAERKRRAAVESTNTPEEARGGGLRRDVWVRPGRRSTTLRRDVRPDPLANLTPVELNKTFVTSYLHVHGKLITKIGMETFHESASAMLKQFRALLNRQPLPTPAVRLLQLTALNMFAVETTSMHKDASNGDERPAWLECALGVSLLMFGALLERCCALLPEPAHTQQHSDALLLLPAIKVWSDWMLCHSSVWNPPPSFDNFQMETENDPWDWLAKLMNILEELDDKTIDLESEPKDGYMAIRLAEDSSLAGFTPLMYMEPAAAWLPEPLAAPHTAEHVLRTRKLLFFGTEYLVGVEPPVLRLEYPADGAPRYVSAVDSAPRPIPALHHLSEDSEDDDSVSTPTSGPTSLTENGPADGTDEATRKLLKRKEQLENRKATLERRRERMQEILRGGWVSVEVEVRPRWLVPDTNCFIDHLPLLQAVEAAPAQPYLLAVPLVVVTELDGLKRCARVGGRATAALEWVRGCNGARLATTRGSLLASRAFTAAAEKDAPRGTNDDRVLATALSLHANLASEPDTRGDEGDDKCVKRVREVVLLTDDRNLRVKALAADLPARDLPSFVHWAGLDTKSNSTDTDAATSGQ